MVGKYQGNTVRALIDPRTSIIDERLRNVKRIVAVTSGKGGVGKSLLASTLALALVEKGFRVGLFDLDFTSPSTHMILGVAEVQPKEEKGIVPPVIDGMEYMSIVYYTREHAAPLRGADVSNALIELLSVTRWGNLDFLVLDMPPGIGDATLDLIRLIKRIEFLVVTTPSRLAFETVRKLVMLLKDLRLPVIGVVENMKVHEADRTQREVNNLEVPFLNIIPFDAKIENAIGRKDKLLRSTFAESVKQLAAKIAP
jgi:ATP-binding protein involved in chromosome partitioning